MFLTQPNHSPVRRHPNAPMILNHLGEECGFVSHWSDNPVRTAIHEARRVVCLSASFGIEAYRVVVDKSYNVIFRASLHPARIAQMKHKIDSDIHAPRKALGYE